jgi:hypothetical protein
MFCYIHVQIRHGLGRSTLVFNFASQLVSANHSQVCDNQRYGIDKILNGKTVFEMNTGRGGVRKYSSWANKQRAKQYRTAVQGNRPNRWLAACDLDEFPMGILKDSANNNPQACRLVNRVGNAGNFSAT